MLFVCVAAIPIVIWCVLLLGRGGFWRVRTQLAPRTAAANTGGGRVAVIIPARDEAAHIGETVAGLIQQDYTGDWHIFVVDDNSSDGTAHVAQEAARLLNADYKLTVLRGRPLPSGWTGKLWALSQGINEALSSSPDFLLFTDADILHGPHSLTELVMLAQTGNHDLVSFMVKLRCETLAERTLIPAFVFFFFLLYPPRWIASNRHRTAGAAGGCVLIRPERLTRIGGIAAIANQVIDDCALAKSVKKSGGRVWLGLTEHRFSLRTYGSFGEVGRMISRTAFNQLQHSALLLAGTIVGLLVVYVLPIALLLSGRLPLVIAGALAWTLMSLAYAPMVRFYDRSLAWALALPFVALFYSGATVHSAIQYWAGRGGQWKGRAQDA